MHTVLELLRRLDRSELADNRMTLFAPGFGLGSVHCWDGLWNNDSDGNPRQMREVFENRDGHLQVIDGGEEDILQQDYRLWHPHCISARYIGKHQSIWKETKSIHQDVAVDIIQISSGGLRKRNVTLRHFISAFPTMELKRTERSVRLFCRSGQYAGIHRVIGFAGKGPIKVHEVSGGWAIDQCLQLAPDQPIRTAYIVAAGENAHDTQRRWSAAASHSQIQCELAHNRWSSYFDNHVPAFDCDNTLWKQLYYFSFYVLRANLYDFRKGSIRHPYSCPSKWRLLPSWFWDPCFHGFSEKWLRDYPAPISTFRNHFEAQDDLGYLPMTVDARGDTWRAMGIGERICQQFLHPMTVWDCYLIHGNRAILHECFPPMAHHADYLWEYRRPGGGEPLFIPATGGELADNSSRLVADPARRDQIHTLSQRIEVVDWNTFLLIGERLLARIAREIGRPREGARFADRADLRESALRGLWSAKLGTFTDRVIAPDRRLSARRFAEGFISMLGGYPTRSQARSMVRLLLSRSQFWTQHPVPLLPIDDPSFTAADTYASYWNGRVWPNINWSIIESLFRAGQIHAATRLTHATIAMFVATGEVECTENYHPLANDRYAPTHNMFNYGWGALGIDLILRRSMGIQPNAPKHQIGLRPVGLPDCTEAQVIGIPSRRGTFDVRAWRRHDRIWRAELVGHGSGLTVSARLDHWLCL